MHVLLLTLRHDRPVGFLDHRTRLGRRRPDGRDSCFDSVEVRLPAGFQSRPTRHAVARACPGEPKACPRAQCTRFRHPSRRQRPLQSNPRVRVPTPEGAQSSRGCRLNSEEGCSVLRRAEARPRRFRSTPDNAPRSPQAQCARKAAVLGVCLPRIGCSCLPRG